MSKAIKTAISLPEETYLRAESVRRKAGKSRSELYAEALRAYFKAQEVREKEALYIAGYRKRPENTEEMLGLIQAGYVALPKEEW